jgi:hypothetical protein
MSALRATLLVRWNRRACRLYWSETTPLPREI